MNRAFDEFPVGISYKQMGALHGLGVDDGVVNNTQLAARWKIDVKADPRRHDLGAVDHERATVAIAQ